VFTVALGIGLNSSIFTLFDATMLQPLPVKDPHTDRGCFSEHRK